jgi:hypothetical protein
MYFIFILLYATVLFGLSLKGENSLNSLDLKTFDGSLTENNDFSNSFGEVGTFSDLNKVDTIADLKDIDDSLNDSVDTVNDFTDSPLKSHKFSPFFTYQIFEPNYENYPFKNSSNSSSNSTLDSLVRPTKYKKKKQKKKKKGFHLDAGIFFEVGKSSYNASHTGNYVKKIAAKTDTKLIDSETANSTTSLVPESYSNLTFSNFANLSFSNNEILAMSDKERKNKGLHASAGLYFNVDLEKNQVEEDDEDCKKFWFWPYMVDNNLTNANVTMSALDHRYEIPNKFLLSKTKQENLFTSENLEEALEDKALEDDIPQEKVQKVPQEFEMVKEEMVKGPKADSVFNFKSIGMKSLTSISDFNNKSTEPALDLPKSPDNFDKIISKVNESTLNNGLKFRQSHSFDSSASIVCPTFYVILFAVGCIL